MTNLFLKPARDAEGRAMLVRDPVTMKPLAADGEWKTQAPYWIRRLADKDVIAASPASSAPAPAPNADAATTSPASAAPPVPAAETAGETLLSLIKPAD